MPKIKSATVRKLCVLLLTLGIVFIIIKYCREKINIPEVLKMTEQMGLWAPIFYILIYILISGVFLPSLVIKIFAGTLFGVVWGIVFVSVAATISSLIKFLLARYLFRESIQKKVERNEKLKALDQVIEKDGWKMLMILRNIPIVNCMFLNYICGLTKMRLKDYMLASFIGKLPTTIMYVYLGYIVRHLYTTESVTTGREYLTLDKIVLFIGLAAAVGATFYLIHLSRKVFTKKASSITAPH